MVHLRFKWFDIGLSLGLGFLFRGIRWFMTDSWRFGLGFELRVANVFKFFPIPHTAYMLTALLSVGWLIWAVKRLRKGGIFLMRVAG